MRWLAFAALALATVGCTVQVVERPATPVVVTHAPYVAPAYIGPPHGRSLGRAPRAPGVTARPATPPPRARPAPPAQQADGRRRSRGRAAAKPPSESRPASLADVDVSSVRRDPAASERHEPPREARGKRPRRGARGLHRFDLDPDDVPPIKDEPAGGKRLKRFQTKNARDDVRSTGVAKPQ
jgi:hypothetical protein